MNVTNAVFPGMEQIASFFGGPDDGKFVMVNLLKFKEKAEYEDGSDAEGPAESADAVFAGEFEVRSGAILQQFKAAAKKWEKRFNIPASQSRAHKFRF